MGQNHSTYQDFNAVGDFGFRYVNGSTNGPGTGSSQFYSVTFGLGNDYSFANYAMQIAIPRYNSSDRYVTFRTREATTWGSWYKIYAGYADSAGNSTTTSQTEFASLTIGGRPVATQDWVTSQGYLTTFSESDTLDSVTDRGATTTNSISVGNITASGLGSDGNEVIRIVGTASDAFNYATASVWSNLTAGETVAHVIGKAESQYNTANFGYRHVADGSSSNHVTIGMLPSR